MLSVCYVHCYEVKVHFYHTFANLTRVLMTRQLLIPSIKIMHHLYVVLIKLVPVFSSLLDFVF